VKLSAVRKMRTNEGRLWRTMIASRYSRDQQSEKNFATFCLYTRGVRNIKHRGP